MTPEDRIEALEKEVGRLNARLDQAIKTIVEVTTGDRGGARAFEQAVLSILTATPPNETLDKDLTDRLGVMEAYAVGEVKSEEHIDGMQLAIKQIVECRLDAVRRSMESAA